MDVFENLNINQMAAVMNESRACLVNAQVGSGKTTVLIAKVCFLHQFRSVPLSNMVVLTFTNKAANEIKDRLKAVYEEVTDDDLAYFGTFHSVALKMLKTLAPLEKIGYSSDFAVMDADEKVDLANVIINSNQLTIKYASKIEKRLEEAVKGNFTYGSMKHPDDIEALLELYAKEKRTQGKMDFDDLILNITQLLPEIAYRPKWIIVDEFQDTDDRQMAFIHALASKDTRLFVVGDPNQIIYSWRGSNQRIFDRFASEYDATQLSLPENYRSCATILEVAKCFLKTGSDLSGIREPGNLIKVKNHYNPFNEAQYIASSIQSKVEEGLKYSDIAVFYRLQRQSQVLEDVFNKEHIPFEVSLKKTIKDIPVLKWVILLLRAAVNQLDIESAIAVLSDDHFGEHFSKSAARKIVKASRDTKDGSAVVTMPDLYAYTDVNTAAHDEESDLLLKIDGFEAWSKNNSSAEGIYAYFSLDKHINPTSASFHENKESIIALLKKIDEYIKAKEMDLYTGVKDFVNSSALYGVDVLSEDVRIDTDTVKLMTLHSAKGLEFKQVYIIGVNDGLIPLFAKSDADEQEERRLFFVGITRAKDYLELSYYTSPDESRVSSGPSRYISMIPRRLIDMDGFMQQDVDLQKFRHEILESKATQEEPIDEAPIEEVPVEEEIQHSARSVRHPKYGLGTVIHEDDNMITVLFDGYGEKEFFKAFSELEDANSADTSTGGEPLPIFDYDQSNTPSSSSNSTDESIQDASPIVDDSACDYSEDLHIDSHTLEQAVQSTDAYPMEDTSDSDAYDTIDVKADDVQLVEAAASLPGPATNHIIGSKAFQAAETTEELDAVISEETRKQIDCADEDTPKVPIVQAEQDASKRAGENNPDVENADDQTGKSVPQPLAEHKKSILSKVIGLFTKKPHEE